MTPNAGNAYLNTIPAGALQTTGGGNAEPAGDTLYVGRSGGLKTLTTTEPYVVRQIVQFTVVASNNGPDAASGVVTTDVPTHLTILSVTGPGCAGTSCAIGS